MESLKVSACYADRRDDTMDAALTFESEILSPAEAGVNISDEVRARISQMTSELASGDEDLVTTAWSRPDLE